MKKIFSIVCLLLSLTINAQNMGNDVWKKVQQLENNGRTKDALDLVSKNLEDAKRNKDINSIIRSNLYIYKYKMILEEDSEWKIVQSINDAIKTAEQPEKALLHSILAELLNQYYNSNSWKFAERTKTEVKQSDDFRTWDLQTLYENIVYHYMQSLQDEKILQTTKLENLDDILTTQKNSKTYRPTLYDLLAHRAIDFFSTDFADLTQPQNAFSINNPKLFNDAKEFVNIPITTEDTLSNSYLALSIFQKLLAFRLAQSPINEAMASADYKRLDYLHDHFADKDEAAFLYYNALVYSKEKYTKTPYGDEAFYTLANFINQNLENKYLKNKVEDQSIFTTKNIMKICNDCVSFYPNSEGAKNCKALVLSLQQKSLNITTENVLIPNEKHKALVEYRNISKLYLKWVEIDFNKKDDIFELKENENYDAVLKRLNKIKATKTWVQNLNNPLDYLQHSTEIVLPELPKGYYVLMTSTNPDFSIKEDKNAVSVNQVFVSSISFITKSNSNENFEVYVLDRKTSQPLKGVEITLFNRTYNYQKRKYESIKIGTIQTDANGYAQKKNESNLNQNYNSNYYQVQLKYKDDFLAGTETYYENNYKTYEPLPSKTVHFFTDRSIYRPTQTIYFKGILTEHYRDENRILPNEKVVVYFKDANYQEIAKQELTTNEFGSFSGTFIAPANGLLGSMSIVTDYNSTSVQVEEYKRPKFEVLFDTIKTAYNLNDTITITGKAQSYSGAILDHAKVKYTVTRVPNFPIWWGWKYYFPMPTTSEKIIATGQTNTNENGVLSIDFEALPDLSLDKKYKPYFTYNVNIDVTDINGETQSNNTQVKVGYLAIDASLDVDAEVDGKKENKITVKTNNLNGQFEPTQVELKIYSLKQPANPLKKRLWETPELFLLTETEFKKLFPFDVYNNEDQTQNYPKDKLIKTFNFNTKDQTNFIFKPNELLEGTYLIEFSCKDKNGNPIEFVRTFNVSSFDATTLSPKQFLSLKINNNYLHADKDTLVYKISSSIKNIYVVVEAKHQNKWFERKLIYLDNYTKEFKIPITSELMGGIQIRCNTILENRAYSAYQFVTVPYPSKDLKMEWLTFRNKLLPGQHEVWKLKLSGKDKDKFAAELVTTLYDASLDAFIPHYFEFYLPGKSYSNNLGAYRNTDGFGISNSSLYTSKVWNIYGENSYQAFDDLNLFGLQLGYPKYYRYKMYAGSNMMMPMKSAEVDMMPAPSMEKSSNKEEVALEIADSTNESTKKKDNKTEEKIEVTPRTNLNETAFFMPQLQTDEEGNIILEFTMPEALTKWKLLGFAHTKDLYTTQFSENVITQKELMVVPNAPRFLREGDTVIFSSKITNLSDKDLNGKVSLEIKDALTEKSCNALFQNTNFIQSFSVKQGQNTVAFWKLIVPKDINAITYEVLAKADNFSDGEKNVLPILTNRMLVTESIPLWVSGKGTKKYTFKKLVNNKSKTLEHHALTLEMSSNPAWYAIQALPYLMEYPYECAEQLFSRYYSNTLASHIANSNPKIKNVFDKWKNTNSDALLSNLEKNQELKNVLLEESPWVREAQSETEQKKRIALLFDLTKMAYEQQSALEKLQNLQSPNGGFMWFAGMPENRFITQYIIQGIGHLQRLNVVSLDKNNTLQTMVNKALPYLDERMKEDFDNIKKYDENYLKNNHLSYFAIQYLYMRSFFLNNKIDKKYDEAYTYFLNQAKQFWNQNNNMQMKAMLSMILFRNNEKKLANTIIESFRQNAINSEELGMYWKALENQAWYWYEAPVETQALIIEAYTEISNDEKSIDAMKLWLLKQKQTTSWKSTKATAEACYALLLSGSDWVNSDNIVEVSLDGKKLDETKLNIEEGTGYYKTVWYGDNVKQNMGNIQLKKKDKGPAYGAMYWQYFEDLDKITSASTNLQLSKKYFIKTNTPKGTVLKEITANTPIKVGDLITVRIELKTDRNLEYVHLKDLRSAGTEPTNVISSYKWQDGFGYYETTRDVATHFFIDWLNKGNYVFEYTLRASLAGNFSSGITQIECMYAPEFKAHSQGERQTIEP